MEQQEANQEEPICYKMLYNEKGEPRPRYLVNHRDQEGLREVVRGIMDGSLFPSVSVSEDVLPIVFMPLSLGALSVPDELREELSGPRPAQPGGSPPDPPEAPELPPSPVKPDIEPAPKAGDPLPPLPYNEDLRIEFKWGDGDSEEWERHKAEVDQENEERACGRGEEYRRRVAAWEARRDQIEAEWQEALDARERELEKFADEIAAHEAAVEQYKKTELANWEQGQEDLQREWDAWQEKDAAIFSDWYKDVGVLLGVMSEAGPRSINGYPIFYAFQTLHREDWDRVHAACMREHERMQNLEV